MQNKIYVGRDDMYIFKISKAKIQNRVNIEKILQQKVFVVDYLVWRSLGELRYMEILKIPEGPFAIREAAFLFPLRFCRNTSLLTAIDPCTEKQI